MSKPSLVKRLEVLEQKNGVPNKVIVLKMWCPGGKTTHSNSGRLRIEPTNPVEKEHNGRHETELSHQNPHKVKENREP